MTTSVDLGSGNNPKNPFKADVVIGCDINNFNRDDIKVCILGYDSLPFGDNEIDYFTAFDLFEHIPKFDSQILFKYPFIFLMNEIWRSLRPGGKLYAEMPTYPNMNLFTDPTHVNYITPESARYFAREVTGDGHIMGDDRLEYCKGYGFVGKFLALRNICDLGRQIWLFQAVKE